MYRFIVITSLLHCVLSGAIHAQETLDPVVVSQLSEVIPDAEQEWKYYSREQHIPPGCLSAKGLVINSEDTVSFYSIDKHGKTLWTRLSPEEMEPAFVRCSRDGRYILAGHYDDQNNSNLYEILTSDGQILWSRVVPSYHRIRYWIANSSEYIVFVRFLTEYDWTYNITVVDIDSGQNLWSKNTENVALVEWGSDKLAYVYRDSLSVLAIDTGELKWRRSIDQMSGSSDAIFSNSRRYNLVPSEDGTKLVVSATGYKRKERGIRVERVGVFDQKGQLMWESENKAGTPLGITPDNRFLVSIESLKGENSSEYRDQLKLTNMSTGAMLWTLPGGFRKNGNWFVFLKDRLFLCFTSRYRGNLPRGILMLDLDSSGQIARQTLLPIHGIESFSRRTEAWLSKNASAQREVFLVFEGGHDWGSYFIESIGH